MQKCINLKKKTASKLIFLISIAFLLSSSSIATQTVAQESIDITSYGCVGCSFVTNRYHVDWDYTGTIPYVSINIYNLSMTTIEYIVTSMTVNLGSYNWTFPISHTLDGEYYLVVSDYYNSNVNDTVLFNVYPIQGYTPFISGYPIILIGLTIGITSMVMIITLIKKLKKK